MANHANRCMQVTCNFTHPSAQTGNRVYPSGKYVYSFPADHIGPNIHQKAKKQYAMDNNIRSGWIGYITINTSIRNNMKATHALSDEIVLRG